jgi:enoyl-CoA hydratase/carnithine racemase
MTYDEIRYEVAARVATITLARPERRNAWTRRMGGFARRSRRRAATRCAIVITGAGRTAAPIWRQVAACWRAAGGVSAALAW